ncbi:NRDE family protein [Virgibacillus xinjiangensis]|uniref:NRDE family protein n=1 Tax=Virgibacillus xinjiangensis TaxID=393090 RepID=A0ABV7CR37_9BACI
MCLINFHFQEHPVYPLIVAANRDEFYDRPTKPAHFWEDEPNILAGRDLEQMGTWLGITKDGRFAALTNYRNPEHMKAGSISRGEIVKQYLSGNATPEEYIQRLQRNRDKYTGFNLIAGNKDKLLHYNNVYDDITEVGPGTHGLSNDTLNTPWPKVGKGKTALQEYVDSHETMQPDALFSIISDAERAPKEQLPDTGVGMEMEKRLSPLFIQLPDYGTRSSSVLLIDHSNNVTFIERSFQEGQPTGERRFDFQIGQS